MKLSVIIPAYNEEKYLGRCLESVHRALGAVEGLERSEVIVVDNNSSDSTAEVARRGGALVVHEPVNQISRARNRGAKSATGDWFLFIDADSILKEESLRALLEAIERGRCAGGGSVVALDDAPLWGRLFVASWNLLSRIVRWAAGSFLFARADAFREVGGFSEELFAAEEIGVSSRLKKWGKAHKLGFVVLRGTPHVSSGRKFQLYKKREVVCLFLRGALSMGRALRDPKRLDYFYGGRR